MKHADAPLRNWHTNFVNGLRAEFFSIYETAPFPQQWSALVKKKTSKKKCQRPSENTMAGCPGQDERDRTVAVKTLSLQYDGNMISAASAMACTALSLTFPAREDRSMPPTWELVDRERKEAELLQSRVAFLTRVVEGLVRR